MTDGRYSFTTEFLPAVSAAFRAAQTHPELGWTDHLYPGSGFNLGREFPSEHALTAGKLSYPAASADSLAHYLTTAVPAALFANAMTGVASRHKALTLVPWSAADVVDTNPWPSHKTYRVGLAEDQGYDRVTIDPLAGVTSLEAAYRRAAAFGATGIDRTYLAWAILLANADAASTSAEPMESWVSHAGSVDLQTRCEAQARWRDLLSQIQIDTKLVPTVTVIDIITRANPFILPWAEEWLVAHGLHFLTFDRTDEQGYPIPQRVDVGWGQRPEYMHAESIDDKGYYSGTRLWFYDAESMPALPAILRDQEVANLVLQTTSLTATAAKSPEFTWCPVGASDSHVLVQEVATGRWRAVQLF
ncbi:hypothetical protein BKN37_14535 [Mycobacterium talmoniae]|uniref:Uncharacterized protein n=1 Tax=Mycobacterium talmoniae TaxID=1858794 RepID=A0A1S1NL74_9MYCO|nr:hypothetical protein BKN37_14535 [Mycobacterium talmoniae]